MIIPSSQTNRRRRGATTVEFSVVCILFFTMLFGIFEYCRFLMVLHVTNNAARDAARYAVVKTNGGNMPGDPSTIPTHAQLETVVKTGMLGGQPVATGMGGLESNIEDFAVTIFTVDPDGLALNPPVIRPVMNGSTPAAWNSAGFGQRIGVRVSGNYRPIAAGLLLLPSSIPFQVTVMVSSEAN